MSEKDQKRKKKKAERQQKAAALSRRHIDPTAPTARDLKYLTHGLGRSAKKRLGASMSGFLTNRSAERPALNDLNAAQSMAGATISAVLPSGEQVKVPLELLPEIKAPQRHQELDPDTFSRLKAVHAVLGPLFDGKSLEEWVDDFKRDLNPDKEILVWERIHRAWNLYHERFLHGKVGDLRQERPLVAALVGMSMGADSLPVPANVALKLAKCMEDALKDQQNAAQV